MHGEDEHQEVAEDTEEVEGLHANEPLDTAVAPGRSRRRGSVVPVLIGIFKIIAIKSFAGSCAGATRHEVVPRNSHLFEPAPVHEQTKDQPEDEVSLLVIGSSESESGREAAEVGKLPRGGEEEEDTEEEEQRSWRPHAHGGHSEVLDRKQHNDDDEDKGEHGDGDAVDSHHRAHHLDGAANLGFVIQLTTSGQYPVVSSQLVQRHRNWGSSRDRISVGTTVTRCDAGLVPIAA